MTERHGQRPDTPIDEPAPTLTSKARSDGWVVDRRTNSKTAGGGMAPTVAVSMDRPAPTLTGKSGGQWVFRSTAQDHSADASLSDPAPTITASMDNGDAQFIFETWPYTDPATTVAGDPRITALAPVGVVDTGRDARTTQQVQDGDYSGEEPIKLTIEEAAILQSFRPDYPWQGTRSKKFEQIGNAIPVGLSFAVLKELL